MRGRATSFGASAAGKKAARLSTSPAAFAQASDAGPAANDRWLLSQYRELTRKHLGHLLNHLFTDFTGLHFHIAWAPAASRGWNPKALPTACAVCCQIAGTSLAAQPICQLCGPKQLTRTLSADGNGLSFNCRLGVQNYWLPMRVRGVIVGIAYLQALDFARPGPARLPKSARAATKVLSRSEFHRASRLLRLMIQHVQTLDLAELRKTDLAKAGHAVVALEREQARLHEALQRHLPAPPPVARRHGTETHTEQAVHCLLNCISQNYARPITLRGCAAKLDMNAAYLSALFSRAIGRPFKTYLTGHRIEKAKVLLNDPTKSVSDAAVAVGYTSENRFRVAFKQATGLAPKLWRETMRMSPPPS